MRQTIVKECTPKTRDDRLMTFTCFTSNVKILRCCKLCFFLLNCYLIWLLS